MDATALGLVCGSTCQLMATAKAMAIMDMAMGQPTNQPMCATRVSIQCVAASVLFFSSDPEECLLQENCRHMC